jgi:hypothetical protein
MEDLQRYDASKCMLSGIMFEKSTVIQCYVTPAILKRTMTRKSTPMRKNYKTSTMTINLITKKRM